MEQNCFGRTAVHYDWFIFKLPVNDFTTANVNTLPQNAAYFGDHGNPDYLNDGYSSSANEFLHTIQVDEYGFVYIFGATQTIKWGGNTDTKIMNVFYAKTHWEFTWEMEDYLCDRRCMTATDPARFNPELPVTENTGDCATPGCETYGHRFTRPMQFRNEHQENGKDPFMVSLKGTWNSATNTEYNDMLLWPINEHMDSENVQEAVAADDDVEPLYEVGNVETVVSPETPCDGGPLDVYWGRKYDPTLVHTHAFRRNCFRDGADPFDTTGNPTFPTQVKFNTYEFGPTGYELSFELVGFASSGYTVTDFRVQKDYEYSI